MGIRAPRCNTGRRKAVPQHPSATRPSCTAAKSQFLAATLPFIRHGLAARGDGPRRRRPGEDRPAPTAPRPGRGRRDLRRHRRCRPQSGDDHPPLVRLRGTSAARPVGASAAIGEPAWPGRSDAALVECRNHEALINAAFADGPSWHLLCPYDADGLGSHVIADARLTHPYLIDGDGAVLERRLRPASHAAGSGMDDPLPPATTDTPWRAFGPTSLGEIRSLVAAFASTVGLAPVASRRLRPRDERTRRQQPASRRRRRGAPSLGRTRHVVRRGARSRVDHRSARRSAPAEPRSRRVAGACGSSTTSLISSRSARARDRPSFASTWRGDRRAVWATAPTRVPRTGQER